MRSVLFLGAGLGVLIALGLVVTAVRSGNYSSALQVLPPAGAAEALTASMPGGVGYGEVVVDVVSNQDRSSVVVVALVDAALCLLGAAMLYLLGRVFDDAQKGHPFSAVSAARMSRVAWLSAGFAITAFYVKPFTIAWASARVAEGSWSVTTSLVPVFLVVVAFALAAIWRRGAELAEFDEHAI